MNNLDSLRPLFISFVLVLLATIMGAFGSLFLKIGSSSVKSKNPLLLIRLIFKNKSLFVGFLLYGASTVPFLIALKFSELSIVYPLVSLSYIWVILLSKHFLKEKINKEKLIGIFLIILGVVLIGLSS